MSGEGKRPFVPPDLESLQIRKNKEHESVIYCTRAFFLLLIFIPVTFLLFYLLPQYAFIPAEAGVAAIITGVTIKL